MTVTSNSREPHSRKSDLPGEIEDRISQHVERDETLRT